MKVEWMLLPLSCTPLSIKQKLVEKVCCMWRDGETRRVRETSHTNVQFLSPLIAIGVDKALSDCSAIEISYHLNSILMEPLGSCPLDTSLNRTAGMDGIWIQTAIPKQVVP